MTALLHIPVLVLNRDFQFLRAVPARSAFTLLARRAGEVVSYEEGAGVQTFDFTSWAELGALQAEFEADRHRFIPTPRGPVAVPRRVRLLSYARFHRPPLALTRRNIFLRDAHTCQYCGQKVQPDALSIDHVRPRCQGGLNTWENLVCACVPCNAAKAGRTPVEAGMRLRKAPVKPDRLPLRASAAPATWDDFVAEAYWNAELDTKA